jgi:phage terminase large subunit
MKIQAGQTLRDLLSSSAKIKSLRGGSRSGKTWGIIYYLIIYCQNASKKGEQKTITIARQKLTWLKATLLKDFIQVLKRLEIYRDSDFHKSEMTYNLFGCEIGFFGLDEPQKLHGRKQDVFWINEAIEATIDDFDQLEMRTAEFGILDYNPSVTKHWIYDRVESRPDCDMFHSTMLDNPFLEQSIIDKIKSYEPNSINLQRGTADDNKWKIYGLGVPAQVEGVVFTNINFVKDMPQGKRWIGLDFGFTNDPTAIVEVTQSNGEIYVNELAYERGLTNADISKVMESKGVHRTSLIVADSAEPKSIEELRRMGWNIIAVTKGQGSVNFGIDILRSKRINITENSLNFKIEAENYTWRKDRRTGEWLNVPIDDFNHLWDALRFVAMETMNTKPNLIKPMRLGQTWMDGLK